LLTLFWLAAGLVPGVLFVMYGRAARAGMKSVFGVGLLVAALIYLLFVWRAPHPLQWTAVEAAGAGGFGLMAWLGVRSSAWWLVAGWALHPAWDLGLHYLGPGHFAPAWYALMCVSFDLLVAGYVAFAISGNRPGRGVGQQHSGGQAGTARWYLPSVRGSGPWMHRPRRIDIGMVCRAIPGHR